MKNIIRSAAAGLSMLALGACAGPTQQTEVVTHPESDPTKGVASAPAKPKLCKAASRFRTIIKLMCGLVPSSQTGGSTHNTLFYENPGSHKEKCVQAADKYIDGCGYVDANPSNTNGSIPGMAVCNDNPTVKGPEYFDEEYPDPEMP
mgnify:CR=1 FL=1